MPPSRWASFAAEAAVPEQLVPYVRAVSDLEPLECGGFLAWRSGPALVLVGHDAGLKQGGAEQERSRPEAVRLDAAVGEASSLRGIESLTVLAPFRPDAAPEWAVSTKPDAYWGIPLPTDAADMAYGQKLRNQLRRARRDILIAREGWKPDHAGGTVYPFAALRAGDAASFPAHRPVCGGRARRPAVRGAGL